MIDDLRLNLGCGQHPVEGWTNVDWIDGPGVDQVANLEDGWPWDSDSVDELYASHLIEHIADPLHFMEEAWRVAKPGAQFTLACPYGSSDDADEDPTHVRRMFLGSWGYFGQPIYWRGNTDYRGDWQVKVLDLRLTPEVWAQCGSVDSLGINAVLTNLHRKVSQHRNVVQEMIALLECVKPARPKDRLLQEDKVLQYKLIGADGQEIEFLGSLVLQTVVPT